MHKRKKVIFIHNKKVTSPVTSFSVVRISQPLVPSSSKFKVIEGGSGIPPPPLPPPPVPSNPKFKLIKGETGIPPPPPPPPPVPSIAKFKVIKGETGIPPPPPPPPAPPVIPTVPSKITNDKAAKKKGPQKSLEEELARVKSGIKKKK